MATAFLVIAAAVSGSMPTAADFASAHIAVCDAKGALSARVRGVRCIGFKEEPTEFKCSYKLPERDGSWGRYTAYIAMDGNKWIWLDGETRCALEPQLVQ